jgi:hypothetical protein
LFEIVFKPIVTLDKETMMRRLNLLCAVAPWALLLGTAGATQYPIMEKVASKVV